MKFHLILRSELSSLACYSLRYFDSRTLTFLGDLERRFICIGDASRIIFWSHHLHSLCFCSVRVTTLNDVSILESVCILNYEFLHKFKSLHYSLQDIVSKVAFIMIVSTISETGNY